MRCSKWAASTAGTSEARVLEYHVPLEDITAALHTSGIVQVTQLAGGATVDDLNTLIAEFGRFAAGIIAPTDRVADREGVELDRSSGTVTVPPVVKRAYAQYVDAGWGAATVPEAYGGGGLPYMARLVFEEILCSASLSFSLNPMLTHGALDLLAAWGSDDQRARYLLKLATGAWTGTMNLTEPAAGSDVGAIRTAARREPDGTWRVTGTKIFVTWGDHDAAENIVHMVLARTSNAPTGTKGISLFIVPRNLADGTRNAVSCMRVEEKLGLHGSPTCVLQYDGAVGELVGAEHSGMQAMFTMMNSARLAIAVQGLATGQRSFDDALAYAAERHQGDGASGQGPVAIIEHPDVRRMLLDLRSTTRAMRLLLLHAAAEADVARIHPDPSRRTAAAAALALLTPMAKAWCTDQGFRLASVAMQVQGGAGYIEETGVAQRLRDSRIAPIYEGTNGIQAIDLIRRKVRADRGVGVHALIERIKDDLGRECLRASALSRWSALMTGACQAWHEATRWVLGDHTAPDDVLAGASAYLDLAARVTAGWRLGLHAMTLVEAGHQRASDAVVDADFFAVEVLAPLPGVLCAITAGAARLEIAPPVDRHIVPLREAVTAVSKA